MDGVHDNERRHYQTGREKGDDAGNARNGSSDAGEQDTLNEVGDTAAIAAAAAGDGGHFGQDGCSAVAEDAGRTLAVGPG